MMVREVWCRACNHLTLILEHEPLACKGCGARGLIITVGPLEPLVDSFTQLKG